MKTWSVIVHTEGQPDETIELTDESRRLLLDEAKARAVHPDVILREVCLEQQATRLKWRRLQAAANECASLVKAAPQKVDHDAVAVTLMAIIGGILRGAVKRGELGGIQNVVMAADSLASEIKRAHKLHPEKLRQLAEKLPKLTVSISRGAVADDNPERRQVREFLVQAGVGMKSIPPTGTKTHSDNLWATLAEMLLSDIMMMQNALKYQSQGNAFVDSLVAPHLEKAERYRQALQTLPVLSRTKVAPWWRLAKDLLYDYWTSNPAEVARAEKKALDDDRCKRRQEGSEPFAVAKVYECFRALARAQCQNREK